MKLEEAIRDLKARVVGEFSIEGEDDCADMKLGIEALRFYAKCKWVMNRYFGSLLPGETEE